MTRKGRARIEHSMEPPRPVRAMARGENTHQIPVRGRRAGAGGCADAASDADIVGACSLAVSRLNRSAAARSAEVVAPSVTLLLTTELWRTAAGPLRLMAGGSGCVERGSVNAVK
jgi:hypothetical protein